MKRIRFRPSDDPREVLADVAWSLLYLLETHDDRYDRASLRRDLNRDPWLTGRSIANLTVMAGKFRERAELSQRDPGPAGWLAGAAVFDAVANLMRHYLEPTDARAPADRRPVRPDPLPQQDASDAAAGANRTLRVVGGQGAAGRVSGPT